MPTISEEPTRQIRPMDPQKWKVFVVAYIVDNPIASIKWEEVEKGGGVHMVTCEITVKSGYMAGFSMECPTAMVDRSAQNNVPPADTKLCLSSFAFTRDDNPTAHFEFVEGDDEKVRNLRCSLLCNESVSTKYTFYQSVPERKVSSKG